MFLFFRRKMLLDRFVDDFAKGPMKKIKADLPVAVEEMKRVRAGLAELVREGVLTLEMARESGGQLFLAMYVSGNPAAVARVKRIMDLDEASQQKAIKRLMAEALNEIDTIIPGKSADKN